MKYKGVSVIKNKKCKGWYARYTLNGKQVYISAKTQQECYDKLKKGIDNKEKLKLKKTISKEKTNSITLAEWFKKYVELYKQDVKDTTKDDYKYSFCYVKTIENKSLNKITSLEILELLNKIEFSRRKQKVYDLLKDLFKKAKMNKFIDENPLEFIDKPKHTKINGIAFSNEDEEILKRILIEKNLDCFLICLYQGLRRGEILALTIDDLDFEKRTITIAKAMNEKSKIDSTKNTYSNRVIPMFDVTYNLLLKYKNSTGRLFKISIRDLEKTYRNIITENFPNKKYTIHSLRHTFVTKCQEANIPLHIIQHWIGHNIGSDVTMRVYTHFRDNAETENISVFNKINI